MSYLRQLVKLGNLNKVESFHSICFFQRISGLFVQVKKALDHLGKLCTIKTPNFIGLYLDLCAR